MYKVVIVDDEPIIVEGLQKIINWERLGCEIAGTAENGNEGLDLVMRIRPDIIMTDIAMPGMNGLSMIAALRSEFPNTAVCILTGYRDFDYAQRAISLGVSGFLLKPSNPKQIEETIENIISRMQPVLRTDSQGNADNSGETASHDGDGEGLTEKGEGASSFVVKNAVSYMERHYAEHLSLSDVADHVYVSQWHLSKLLNKYQEKGFSEILNEIRITRAKELLKDPGLRIGDIAERVGFSDIAHFSRAFKKFEGISANEYRNTRL